MKPKFVIDKYLEEIPFDVPFTVLELGVFEAGSALAIAASRPNARVIGLDFANKPHLDEIILAHGLSDRVKIYHGVKQEDERALRHVLEDAKVTDNIDLIVDDCSHIYASTRSSFETLFPCLR